MKNEKLMLETYVMVYDNDFSYKNHLTTVCIYKPFDWFSTAKKKLKWNGNKDAFSITHVFLVRYRLD